MGVILQMPLALSRSNPPARASRIGSLAGATLAAMVAIAPGGACGQTVLTPLPPERPFDLGLQSAGTTPLILVPPRAQAPAALPQGAPSPASTEPDEDQGPEWPQLTPGQKAGAEPAFDPEERPEKPGISTDPGTSIVCLPQSLKDILAKVAAKFGAVKVTSTWRPPWRARRASYHKRCEAMDFRVPGIRPRVVLDFARALPEVGGNKVYWNGLIHIDTGPRRAW